MNDYTRKDYERMLNKRPLVTISHQKKQIYEVIEIVIGVIIVGGILIASIVIG